MMVDAADLITILVTTSWFSSKHNRNCYCCETRNTPHGQSKRT